MSAYTLFTNELTGRESVILERNWAGRGYVVQGEYTCFEDSGNMWHFAVDEQHGLLLVITGSSSHKPVLTVRTLDGAHVVWQMSMVCIRPSLNNDPVSLLPRFYIGHLFPTL
jgi:hypothetical protein